MPMAFKDLPQNDLSFELKVPQDRSYVASVITDAGNNAGATFELRCAFNEEQRHTNGGTPVAISIWDAIAAAEAANLVGSNQYGWADIPGANYVYVVRTDGNGGQGKAAVDLTQSH